MKRENQSAGDNPEDRRLALEGQIVDHFTLEDWRRKDTVLLTYLGARFWINNGDQCEAAGIPIDLLAQYLPVVVNKLDWKRADEAAKPFLGLCHELAEALQYVPRHEVARDFERKLIPEAADASLRTIVTRLREFYRAVRKFQRRKRRFAALLRTDGRPGELIPFEVRLEYWEQAILESEEES